MCVEGILLVRSSESVCTKTTVSILVKSGIASYTIKLFIFDFDSYLFTMRNRCSVAGIATTLQAGRSEARIPVRVRDFSVLRNSQTVSVSPPASCWMGIRFLLPRVKRPGREVKHSPRKSAEVRNEWGSAPPTWLRIVDRENFTFHLLSDLFVLVYMKLFSDMISFLKRNFISFSSLSYDRSKASSKASCPHSAI